MKRLINILVFMCLSLVVVGQEETRVVDSLRSVVKNQKGREKVKTMMELSDAFSEFSFDDCLVWGEKAIIEAKSQGYADLEADANYALGEHYGYHMDLDLSYDYLKAAYNMHLAMGNDTKAFEDIWRQAYFEHVYGNIDTALCMYEKVLTFAEQRNDTLGIAKVNSNKAILQYQKQEYQEAEITFKAARKNYDLLNDSIMVVHIDANMACLYMEWGKIDESKKLYRESISKLESLGDIGTLILAYKNYGILFEKENYNYDSVSFYLDKALQCIDIALSFQEGNQEIIIAKADLLLEFGHSNYMLDDYPKAINNFKEVLSMSEGVGYLMGQMKACMELAFIYSQIGALEKAKYYLDRFLEFESKAGNSLTHSKMRMPLMICYARLGRFDEFEYELDHFNEEYAGLVRQVVDLEQQNFDFEQYTASLLSKYETQSNQIKTLQAQRNHYRLAFFGLLAIALFVMVLFVAYKIVRKKRAKIEKG